jgi:hypothetical protein
MQAWIVGGAWLFAALLAIVVLGFAGYELRWKSRRLQSDKAQLDVVIAELSNTGAQLQAATARAQAIRAAKASRDSGPSSALTS